MKEMVEVLKYFQKKRNRESICNTECPAFSDSGALKLFPDLWSQAQPPRRAALGGKQWLPRRPAQLNSKARKQELATKTKLLSQTRQKALGILEEQLLAGRSI